MDVKERQLFCIVEKIRRMDLRTFIQELDTPETPVRDKRLAQVRILRRAQQEIEELDNGTATTPD